MKERVSALMDGELEGRAAAEAMDLLGSDPEALQAWRTYHLISDAMRDMPLLSAGFTGAVAARIAAEPTVLAPQRKAPEPRRPLRWPAAVAAGLAGVGMVGYLAFNPQSPALVAPAPLAQAPSPGPAVKPALIPLPTATPDYLLAHQAFSPRVSLQGMAPYVRTVSEQSNEER